MKEIKDYVEKNTSEILRYYSKYVRRELKISDIFPMYVFYDELGAGISPKFDDVWDQSIAFDDDILEKYGLEYAAENEYFMLDQDKFEIFMEINRKEGNNYFKFVHLDEK